MAADKRGQIMRPREERRRIGQDFRDQTGAVGFLDGQQTGGEDHFHDAGRTDQRGKPGDICHRQAIAQRARDRKSEPGVAGGNPQIACGGDTGTATRACARDGRDCRHRAAFDIAENLIELCFIGNRIISAGERAELRDVSSGGEGLLAGAGDNKRPNCAGRTRDLRQPLIHAEGQGVAGRRAVQRDDADGAGDVIQQFVIHDHGLGQIATQAISWKPATGQGRSSRYCRPSAGRQRYIRRICCSGTS